MVLDEVGKIVNDTGDGNESLSVGGLLLVLVEGHDGKLLKRNTPVEGSTELVELFLLLLEAALLNLVGAEGLEVVRKANLLHCPDEPLGRVIYELSENVLE